MLCTCNMSRRRTIDDSNMQGGFRPDESVGSASFSLVPADTQSSRFVPRYVRPESEMCTRGRTMDRSLIPTRGSHVPMPNTVFLRSRSSSPVPGSSYRPDQPRQRALSPRLSQMTRKSCRMISLVFLRNLSNLSNSCKMLRILDRLWLNLQCVKVHTWDRKLQNCKEHYTMSLQRPYLRQLRQRLHKCMLLPMR